MCVGSLEQIPRKGKSLPSLHLRDSDHQALTNGNEIKQLKNAMCTDMIRWVPDSILPAHTPPSSPVSAAPALSLMLTCVADVPQC